MSSYSALVEELKELRQGVLEAIVVLMNRMGELEAERDALRAEVRALTSELDFAYGSVDIIAIEREVKLAKVEWLKELNVRDASE